MKLNLMTYTSQFRLVIGVYEVDIDFTEYTLMTSHLAVVSLKSSYRVSG